MNIVNGLKQGFAAILAPLFLLGFLALIVGVPSVVVYHLTGNTWLALLAPFFHALFWAGFYDGVDSE